MQASVLAKWSRPAWADAKVVLVLAVLAATAWMQWATPVMSEECYYWLYGVNLDWSYFDHPGMIGWTTRLGTWLLGTNAFGLRLVAAWTALLTTWLGLRWIRDLGGERSAELLWLALSLGVPLFAAGHLLATPDAPLTFFYALAARELWKLSRSPRWWRFALAGALMGLALLSKYTAVFLLFGLPLHIALDPGLRKRIRPHHLVVLLASCAVTFAPAVLWNLDRGWESFLFQSEDRYQGLRISLEWPLRFLGGQLLLVSPLLAWVVFKSTAWAVRRARSGDVRYAALVAYGLPLPLFMAINSFAIQIREHWPTPAYVPLALLGTLWWQAEGRERSGVAVRRVGGAWIALTWVVSLALPMTRFLPQLGGTHWDPDGEVGRHALAAVDAFGQAGEKPAFLFTVSHRDSAALVWYQQEHGSGVEEPVPVLAQNVRGRPAKQFDHWAEPEQFIGWNAVFALDGMAERTGKIEGVREHFDSVELVDTVELSLGSLPLRRVRIFACRNYHGSLDEDSRREGGAQALDSMACLPPGSPEKVSGTAGKEKLLVLPPSSAALAGSAVATSRPGDSLSPEP
jgi:4-amino-4-deoxy-L-arabinose transferase-like glycosyltransferase